MAATISSTRHAPECAAVRLQQSINISVLPLAHWLSLFYSAAAVLAAVPVAVPVPVPVAAPVPVAQPLRKCTGLLLHASELLASVCVHVLAVHVSYKRQLVSSQQNAPLCHARFAYAIACLP